MSHVAIIGFQIELLWIALAGSCVGQGLSPRSSDTVGHWNRFRFPGPCAPVVGTVWPEASDPCITACDGDSRLVLCDVTINTPKGYDSRIVARGRSHGTAAGNIGAATRGLVIEQYPQRHGGWRGENSRSVGKPNPKPRVRSDNHTARGSRLLTRCRRFIDRNTWATRRQGQDGLYGFRSGLLRSVRRIGVPGKSNASRIPLTRYRR